MFDEAGSDWSESDTEFNSEQIEVDIDADDIQQYRGLLENLRKGSVDLEILIFCILRY